jgi:hypothetical protein
MIKTIATILTISNIGMAKLAFPDNADFDINYYNTTNCLNDSYVTSTIKTLCLEGKEKCCNSLLKEVGFDSQNQFGVCYPIEISNSSIKAIKYDCRMSKYHGMTESEIFSFIGLFLSVVFVLFGFIFIVCKCFCSSRKGYNVV